MSIKIIPTGVPFIPDSRSVSAVVIVPELPITESQVVAFFKARAKSLQTSTGRNLATVELIASAYGNQAGESEQVAWRVYVDGAGSVTSGVTLDDALEQIQTRAKPENIAASLRAEAANLLAKANALSASK